MFFVFVFCLFFVVVVVVVVVFLITGCSYSKGTTLFESTVTPCKSKTILTILTHSLLLFVVTIIIFLLIINSTSNAFYINQLKMTVGSLEICLSNLEFLSFSFNSIPFSLLIKL